MLWMVWCVVQDDSWKVEKQIVCKCRRIEARRRKKETTCLICYPTRRCCCAAFDSTCHGVRMGASCFEQRRDKVKSSKIMQQAKRNKRKSAKKETTTGILYAMRAPPYEPTEKEPGRRLCVPVSGSGTHSDMVLSIEAVSKQGRGSTSASPFVVRPPPGRHATECTQSS
jgi:hypothetical protein